MFSFPEGFVLYRLPERPGMLHAQARRFCLDVIKEFYGFDYRQDWHGDLDSLLLQGERNHYSRSNRGAFWIAGEAGSGAIVATAAIKGMPWKPALAARLAGRYPNMDSIGSVWRVYVHRNRRRAGLGKALNTVMDRQARRFGYSRLYLHAEGDADATIGFWKSAGYLPFETFASSVHMDKAVD